LNNANIGIIIGPADILDTSVGDRPVFLYFKQCVAKHAGFQVTYLAYKKS
jgi:hypothetical protein